MDLEMTSIQDARVDRITEIALVITDKDLTIVAELPSIIIHADRNFYESRRRPEMQEAPSQENLVNASATSTVTMEEAEGQALSFLKEYIAPKTAPLCGNSIHMDRHFLRLQMPRLEEYLFYRCIDVSSVKELARRWAPSVFEEASRRKGESVHRAAEDIHASIAELAFYRGAFFTR
jgi:oligoribonuclease